MKEGMKMAGSTEEKDKREALKGYLTLEAAMVFPMVFALIIMLLYATFFLYDKCRMTQDLYTAAYRQSIARNGKAGGQKADTSGYFMLNSCEAGVSGQARLMAAASADLKDREPSTSQRFTTWKGRAMIVVRSSRKAGQTNVSVKSSLPTSSISIAQK